MSLLSLFNIDSSYLISKIGVSSILDKVDVSFSDEFDANKIEAVTLQSSMLGLLSSIAATIIASLLFKKNS